MRDFFHRKVEILQPSHLVRFAFLTQLLYTFVMLASKEFYHICQRGVWGWCHAQVHLVNGGFEPPTNRSASWTTRPPLPPCGDVAAISAQLQKGEHWRGDAANADLFLILVGAGTNRGERHRSSRWTETESREGASYISVCCQG